MARSRSPLKHTRDKPLLMGGIPINRFWPQEKHFFSEKGLPVFQGIPFPLKKKSFEPDPPRAPLLTATKPEMEWKNFVNPDCSTTG